MNLRKNLDTTFLLCQTSSTAPTASSATASSNILSLPGSRTDAGQLAAGEYTMNRFATMYGMEYQGMASIKLEAEMLATKL